MIKNVENPSVANVFSTDDKKLYRIPRYQREYTWGKCEWSDLYDDVFHNERGYFLGSIIVIAGTPSATTGIYEYEVVDGQQRLTTVSILLAAIFAKTSGYKGKGVTNDDFEAEELVPLRSRLVLKVDKAKTRVIPQIQNSNLDDFRWIMKEHAGLQVSMQMPKNFGNRKMAKAFKYFSVRLEDELKGLDDNAAVKRLLALKDILLDASFVQIDVDSQADAYMLFASLNNRGMPLSAVDLIKNALLANLPEDSESELDYHFEQWQELLGNLGDNYKVQERFLRQNYDAFRRMANRPYATAGSRLPLGNVATRSNLLGIYERQIKNDAQGVLDELLTNSALYARIIGRGIGLAEGELDRRFEELARAQGVPSYVLMLFLLKNQERLRLSDDSLATLVRLLVRFFVRRNLTNVPPTYALERLFANICEEIDEQKLSGSGALCHVCDRLVSESASDAVFRESLAGPIYEENRDMTRFVLVTLAAPSVTKEMKGLWERDSKGKYVWTIEHIFPEGKTIPSEWVAMMGGGDPQQAQQVQATHVHLLGNLTLTGYNSNLGNKSFVEKRDRKDKDGNFVGYRNQLNLNDGLVKRDTWTKEDIESRTEVLVSEAMKTFALDGFVF